MIISNHNAACVIVMTLSLLAAGVVNASAQSRPDAPADKTRLKVLWADLEKTEIEATRAVLKLSARPKESVAFLKDRMKPLTIDEEKVKALLDWLGSDDEQVWKSAFEELEYFDPRLAIDLPTLMQTVTETPARQRMVEVLSDSTPGSYANKTISLRQTGEEDSYNFSADNSSWWAEYRVDRLNIGWGTMKKKWTRAVRAIVLLEHIGTPEAVAILKDMATGHPDAQPTKTAKASLKRIADGPVNVPQPTRPDPAVEEARLKALWADLEKTEIDATRAVLKLSERPKKSVAYLENRMKPLIIDEEKVKALLDWLGSDDEQTSKSAFEELDYFDPRLAIDLQTLMDTVIESPARQRMVEVLSGREAGSLVNKKISLSKFGEDDNYNFSADNGSWWAEYRINRINVGWSTTKKKWIRAVRAVVLLEHMGTPDAVTILKDMATGHPDAQPIKAAKDSLKRIGDAAR